MKIKPPSDFETQLVRLGPLRAGDTFVYYKDTGLGNTVHMRAAGEVIAFPVGSEVGWPSIRYDIDSHVYPVDVLDSRWEFQKP